MHVEFAICAKLGRQKWLIGLAKYVYMTCLLSEICAEGFFVWFPYMVIKNELRSNSLFFFWNRYHFKICFPEKNRNKKNQKKPNFFLKRKLSKQNKRDTVLRNNNYNKRKQWTHLCPLKYCPHAFRSQMAATHNTKQDKSLHSLYTTCYTSSLFSPSFLLYQPVFDNFEMVCLSTEEKWNVIIGQLYNVHDYECGKQHHQIFFSLNGST